MKKLIGIDFGGTKIRGIVMDLRGKVLIEKQVKVVKNQKKDLKTLIELIKSLDSREVIGIGIGVPGLLDSKREKIVNLPNLKGWENFKLKIFLKKIFRKRIEIENDGNCLAIAEKKFGNGIKFNNFISLNIGTGLGGGIIQGGKIYRGRGNAAEFGRMNLEEGVEFEDLVSLRAFKRVSKRKGFKGDIMKVVEGAKKGNKKAKEVYAEIGENLGRGILNIVDLFDPEIVLIGGGIMNSGDLILKPTIKYTQGKTKRKLKIKRVKLLKDGGAIGAASLLM